MTSKLPSSDHIIWRLVRTGMYLTALCVILLATASRFDWTEVRTLVYMFIAAASMEGVDAFINRRKTKE